MKPEDREPDRDKLESYDVDKRCTNCEKAVCGAGEGIPDGPEFDAMRKWVVCPYCYRCGECGCSCTAEELADYVAGRYWTLAEAHDLDHGMAIRAISSRRKRSGEPLSAVRRAQLERAAKNAK